MNFTVGDTGLTRQDQDVTGRRKRLLPAPSRRPSPARRRSRTSLRRSATSTANIAAPFRWSNSRVQPALGNGRCDRSIIRTLPATAVEAANPISSSGRLPGHGRGRRPAHTASPAGATADDAPDRRDQHRRGDDQVTAAAGPPEERLVSRRGEARVLRARWGSRRRDSCDAPARATATRSRPMARPQVTGACAVQRISTVTGCSLGASHHPLKPPSTSSGSPRSVPSTDASHAAL